MTQDTPPAIEDYALIGDCMTAALVSREGSIDWLCLPRFDGGACFARLLGTTEHGRWLVAPADADDVSVSRRYLPGTMILETTFRHRRGVVRLTDFMPVGMSNSSVVRIVDGIEGAVPMIMSGVLRFDFGASIPWVTRLDGDHGIRAIVGPDMIVMRGTVPLRGEGMSTVARWTASAGERATFVLSHAASHLALPEPLDVDAAFGRTRDFWEGWNARCRYEGPYRDAVCRSLLTLKALTYAPTGGIVAAPTTSLPEQLGGSRNWDYRFCWLRDATLTLMAFLHSGYTEEAAAWRDWLQRSIAGSPAQVQIMYGLGGERRLTEYEVPWLPGYQGARPVRVGNAAAGQLQLDTYGELMDAMFQARRAGLDGFDDNLALQRAMMEHLEEVWEKPDQGIWEVRGEPRHFTFSKAAAWVAFDRAVRTAEELALDWPVERWRTLRDRIRDQVCSRGFDAERNTFVQSFDGKALDASCLVLGLTGLLAPDDPRMIGTVRAIEAELLQDGLALRYRTDDESTDGLPPGEGVFLACSFWLADNYALQGRMEDATRLFERLLSLRNDVGLLAEEYDPRAGRFTGNFPQAFSHLALINTAFNMSESGGPGHTRGQREDEPAGRA